MQFEIIVLLILASLTSTALAIKKISLLISLPLHHIRGPETSWERGLEILPGAHVAVKGINDDPSILSRHKLQLIVSDSGNEVVQQFVAHTFHQATNPLNIVGISGFLSPKTMSILLPLVRHKGMLLTAYTVSEDLIRGHSDAFIALHSPSAMVNVLLNFMKRMNWNRIGLITESVDTYFFSVAEMLLQSAKTNENITISPYIELLHVTSAVHEIVNKNTRIIFVSTSIRRTMQLICVVYKQGLLWPQYAWIFHSYRIEDFLDHHAVCDIKNAVNGVYMIDNQPHSDTSEIKLISGITFSSYYKQYISSLSSIADEYNTTLRPNGYSKAMYDLVWSTAMTLNESCHQSPSCTHHVEANSVQESYRGHNNRTFRIFHIMKLRQVLIGTVTVYYNSSISDISFNESALGKAPTDELPIVIADPPFAYTLGITFQIGLTALFVTLMLLLYICFHKEPEVKATSFTLSLLMFAGCYFNLIYLSLLHHTNRAIYSLNIPHQNAVCVFLLWLSAPGISLPLMLAILIVKMLRVYHIFNSSKLRLGRYCSDLSLASYVILILAPVILLHITWTISDRYHIVYEYRMQNGFNQLEKQCSSKYQTVWFGILIVYLLVLILALAVVAVITRKVRLQHFKDTKKVNILLFVLCVGIPLTLSCWLLLQTLNIERYTATLPLHIGHSVLIISFQSFLYVPKVFPPSWRYIKEKLQLKCIVWCKTIYT